MADDLRALALAPNTPAERMARLAALLREAGALAAVVVADGDAPEVHRVTAEALRTKLAEDADEQARLASLRCWRERVKHGPPGPEVPPSAEALKGALASACTALEMARTAARRSSSLPLGRALGALETAHQQLAAASKLDQDITPTGRGLIRLSVPAPELQHVSIGPDGVTPGFRVPVTPEDAEKTTTATLTEDEEMKRDGEVYAQENGPRFVAQHADELAALVTTYEDATAQERFDHLRESFWTRTWDAEKTPTTPTEPLKGGVVTAPLSSFRCRWRTVLPSPPAPGSALAELGMDREKAQAGFHGQAFRAVRVECHLGLRETAAGFGISAAEVTALERGERRFQDVGDFKAALDQLWLWGVERTPGLLL